MGARDTLMRALRRLLPARRDTRHVAQQHNDDQLLHQTTQGIGYFLGLPEPEAAELAQGSLAQRQALRAPSGIPVAAGTFSRHARRILDDALTRGCCLLALPFNGPAVALLHHLAADPRLTLVIVESPELRNALPELGLPGPQPPRCSTQDVVKHVKATLAAGGAPTLYVSFPELHTLGEGTVASMIFLGQPCRFSLLESLLYQVGVPTLLTMAVTSEQPVTRLTLASLTAEHESSGTAGKSIGATFGWLAGHLQACARALPWQTLSWQHLYRASEHCQEIERSNQLKQLEAFFDAWKRADAGLDDGAYGLAVARLAALRQPG